MARPVADGGLRAGNRRLKRLRRLSSSRRARHEEQRFVVEGPTMVTEALAIAASSDRLDLEGLYHERGAADEELIGRAEALAVPHSTR